MERSARSIDYHGDEPGSTGKDLSVPGFTNRIFVFRVNESTEASAIVVRLNSLESAEQPWRTRELSLTWFDDEIMPVDAAVLDYYEARNIERLHIGNPMSLDSGHASRRMLARSSKLKSLMVNGCLIEDDFSGIDLRSLQKVFLFVPTIDAPVQMEAVDAIGRFALLCRGLVELGIFRIFTNTNLGHFIDDLSKRPTLQSLSIDLANEGEVTILVAFLSKFASLKRLSIRGEDANQLEQWKNRLRNARRGLVVG